MKYIKALVVILLLAALPIGSWYYLKSGFDYQKMNVESWGDFGQIGDFIFLVQGSKILKPSDLKGKAWVGGFVGVDESESKSLSVLRKLHRQYAPSNAFQIFGLLVTNEKVEISALDSIRLDVLTDLDTSSVFQTPLISRDEILQVAEEVLHIPDSLTPENILVLVDASGIVRNFYNLDLEDDIDRLVQNVVLLLPRGIKPDISMKRQ